MFKVAYLGKVLAHSFRSGTEIMAEGTGRASLTGTLTEELAGNMGRVCDARCVNMLAL